MKSTLYTVGLLSQKGAKCRGGPDPHEAESAQKGFSCAFENPRPLSKPLFAAQACLEASGGLNSHAQGAERPSRHEETGVSVVAVTFVPVKSTRLCLNEEHDRRRDRNGVARP